MHNKDDIKFFKIVNEISNETGEHSEEEIDEKLHELLARIDRINIREFPDEFFSDIMRESIKQSNEAYIKELRDTLDYQTFASEILPEQGDSSTYVKNYFNLVPPFVHGAIIPKNIKQLYAESRWCFVFEQHNAAVALSRAIIEVALKTNIGLSLEHKGNTAGKVLSRAYEVKLIDKKTFEIGIQVTERADRILHRADAITDPEKTLWFLDRTKDFLESFYNRKKN